MIISGTIVKPVSITDIRTTLGVTSTKLSELCKSDKINVYAKFRPLGGGTPTTKPVDPSNAIDIQEDLYTSSTLPPQGPNPGNSWSVAPIKPYYRQGDFDGYYHTTRAPIYRDKQDYYINSAESWVDQNKVYIDYTNYAGNNLSELAITTAQGVVIKPYDMYAYMTIYTKSGTTYLPYSTATNHILSKQKIGSNGNYIEVPNLPDGQYYFTLGLDSLQVGSYRYIAGFPKTATMDKIASLKVEFSVSMSSVIVGYRGDWQIQTSYLTEGTNDSVSIDKALVVSSGNLGINFKVEVKNLTAASLTLSLDKFSIKTLSGNTIFIVSANTTTYPSRDRKSVTDPTVYNSTNNTITLPANHTTYVNIWARRPVSSSTSFPSGTYTDGYQLWYGNANMFTNSKKFTVT